MQYIIMKTQRCQGKSFLPLNEYSKPNKHQLHSNAKIIESHIQNYNSQIAEAYFSLIS